MRREVKISERIWWNPFSWFTREHWESSGTPPSFTVQFLGGDGQVIDNSILRPARYAPEGYIKITIFYGSIGFTSSSRRPGTATVSELGNDARSVTNVRMEYIIDGEAFTLSHN